MNPLVGGLLIAGAVIGLFFLLLTDAANRVLRDLFRLISFGFIFLALLVGGMEALEELATWGIKNDSSIAVAIGILVCVVVVGILFWAVKARLWAPDIFSEYSAGRLTLYILIICGLLGLGFYFRDQPPRQTQNSPPPALVVPSATTRQLRMDELAVPIPSLPAKVSQYLGVNNLRLPSYISKHCAFDLSKGAHPYYIKGDFDGDGSLDYAVDADYPNGIRRGVFVLLSSEKNLELEGWDLIFPVRKRGKTRTLNETIDLQVDAIGAARCESSSVIYIFEKRSGSFQKYFTGD